MTLSDQVTTDLLTRGGKDIAFSDYCPLWKSHRRLVHNSFALFGEGTGRLQDMGEVFRWSTLLHIYNMSVVQMNTLNSCKEQEPFASVVLAAVDGLCEELLSMRGRGFDPSLAVTRAVTNVVCMLVFNATYRHGDKELQEVLQYNNGIVQTIAGAGLVDIFPWMKVCKLRHESDCF